MFVFNCVAITQNHDEQWFKLSYLYKEQIAR